MCNYSLALLVSLVPTFLFAAYGGFVICIPEFDTQQIRDKCAMVLNVSHISEMHVVVFLLYMTYVAHKRVWTRGHWLCWVAILILTFTAVVMNTANATSSFSTTDCFIENDTDTKPLLVFFAVLF